MILVYSAAQEEIPGAPLGRRFVVLDVHAHLRAARTRQEQAEGAHTGKAAVPLADDGGDLTRDRRIAAREVDVEGDQRPAGADDHATGPLVEPRRPEVGCELAVIDPALELRGAAAAKEGRTAPRRGLAVEKDRQAELAADPFRQHE